MAKVKLSTLFEQDMLKYQKRTLKKVRNHVMHASEATEQIIVMNWAKLNEHREPRLARLYAVPNGFIAGGPKRYAIVNHMKKMGLKNGVLDLHLPVKVGSYARGLRIEMKVKHDGWEKCGWKCATDEQRWWRDVFIEQGEEVEVCHGSAIAIEHIRWYLEMNND